MHDCERFLSAAMGEPVRLVEDAERGFPDDTDSPGPTVVSTATLETVASWFPGLTIEEVRRRFRANLEIGDTEPFWEDRLCGMRGREFDFASARSRWRGRIPVNDAWSRRGTP